MSDLEEIRRRRMAELQAQQAAAQNGSGLGSHSGGNRSGKGSGT